MRDAVSERKSAMSTYGLSVELRSRGGRLQKCAQKAEEGEVIITHHRLSLTPPQRAKNIPWLQLATLILARPTALLCMKLCHAARVQIAPALRLRDEAEDEPFPRHGEKAAGGAETLRRRGAAGD